MPKVTLTINGEENYETNYPMITIGRTADNNVSLPEDTNISRYHARIEQREDGFWLIDQGKQQRFVGQWNTCRKRNVARKRRRNSARRFK
ncbi:MAG: FHA domain-containing protein [Blastocatellia bacterium]|nr:FHA domain-containing protein [Blastocatellia bacterium]